MIEMMIGPLLVGFVGGLFNVYTRHRRAAAGVERSITVSRENDHYADTLRDTAGRQLLNDAEALWLIRYARAKGKINDEMAGILRQCGAFSRRGWQERFETSFNRGRDSAQ